MEYRKHCTVKILIDTEKGEVFQPSCEQNSKNEVFDIERLNEECPFCDCKMLEIVDHENLLPSSLKDGKKNGTYDTKSM